MFTNLSIVSVRLLVRIMAVFYAVEFPLEDAKSRGPDIVPESKVNEENGSNRVLWKVVDENGALTEAYFKATSIKGHKERVWRIY